AIRDRIAGLSPGYPGWRLCDPRSFGKVRAAQFPHPAHLLPTGPGRMPFDQREQPMSKSLFRVKPVEPAPHVDAGEPVEGSLQGEGNLKRVLTARHLVLLGIGAIIGAGIFVMTGQAAANHAGPAIMLSFVLAGLACAFAGLCYAEFASMIPVSGSAYSYT